ncbi:MAG: type II secretion system F family protein, partial [Verrucomicrobiota bacterium]
MDFGPEVSRRGLMLFTRQLATLVNAGLPLTRGLEILGRQERSPRFRRVLEELTEGIGAGGMLSDGLRQRPRLFGALYVGMVQ